MEQNDHGFLLIAFSCVMPIQHWNTRMNQVQKYFQEAKIHSCAEVVVGITDDSPMLSWIPHFAMRFLNKTRIGCRGKVSIPQIGEPELASSAKRTL